MIKSRLQISVLTAMLLCGHCIAQSNYSLHLKGVDRDSAFLVDQLGIKTKFDSRLDCMDYVTRIPSLLQSKGYVTASVDSILFDSSFARLVLFTGESYRWARLVADPELMITLDALGWRESQFSDVPMDFTSVSSWQEKILNYYENRGYPFARVWLDSVSLMEDKVSAQLRVDKGPAYKIDSIRVYGEVKISNQFLQRYLEIQDGSLYNKEKLLLVSRRIRELPYIEEEHPSNLTRLGTGAVLNLYLRKKKSSQANILLGFLPNNDQLASKKLLVTGEGNLNLKNEFGAGETIGLNFQKLQVESQRLNLVYQHPYFLNSALGLDLAFDIFKKDSTFVNINLQFGAQYIMNRFQSGKLFLQQFQTIVNGVNTNFIIQNRRLPDEADLRSVNIGIDYEYNNTNYRLNPLRGTELRLVTSVGTKKLKKNSEVLELKDPGDPSFEFGSLYDTMKLKTYQFRARSVIARYFPLGKQSTFKTALNAGIFQSGNIFRNELFQIGGYKLLRGFDEESQYLSQFAIFTTEYRYLVGQNSFFYALIDFGWGRNNSQNNSINYGYFGTGLGLAFETKAGIFNLAWAVGKRNDTELNLRQSKIHFGFVNYF